jgi:hypothetical protein
MVARFAELDAIANGYLIGTDDQGPRMSNGHGTRFGNGEPQCRGRRRFVGEGRFVEIRRIADKREAQARQ